MSEKKTTSNQSPDNESLRPEELLLASMSRNEAADEGITSMDEDDPLNAILRSALQGSDRPAETLSLDLDTSEFEVEDEEEETVEEISEKFDEESDEEFDEEISEDMDGEPVEEISEESDEESDEEFDEEIPEDMDGETVEEISEESDEEFDEEIPEDTNGETVEEISEESDEEFDEEIPEDMDGETVEEISEESDEESDEEFDEESDEESDEEIDGELSENADEKPAEEPAEADRGREEAATDSAITIPHSISREPVSTGADSVASMRPSPFAAHAVSRDERKNVARYPRSSRRVSDDRLNGLSPDETPGGRRLAKLDEENARLLAETDAISVSGERVSDPVETAPTPEPVPESPETDTAASPAEEKAPRSPSGGKNAEDRFRDPLQLGLDDILSDAVPGASLRDRSASAKPTIDTVAPHTYAASEAMADPEERALRDTELHMSMGHEPDLIAHQDRLRSERVREEKAATTPVGGPDAVYTNGGREYTGRMQVETVHQDYINRRRMAVTRICIAAVGALFGILYDLWGAFPSPEGAGGFTDTLFYPLVGVVWTLLVCLPFLTRLGKGCKSLWDFEPTRYAVSALALPVSAVNGIIAVFSDSNLLFGGVALLSLTVAALSEWLALSGEQAALSVVSSGKTAYLLTDELTPASREAQGIVPEGTSVLTAVPAGRVSDPLARFCRYNPYMGRLNYLLPVALLAAIMGAALVVWRGGSLLHQGIPVFTATYLTCLPAAYLLSMNLPLWLSNRLLGRRGAAVLGTAAPAEYANGKKAHLLFPDGDALWATKRKDIALRGDPNAPEWKALAEVLFRLLDTPLAVEPVLKGSTLPHYRIDVLERGDGFIRLHLIDRDTDQAIEVMAGAHDALTRHGIRLPKKNMEMRYKKSDDSHVLYIAFNRRFHLAYSAEYRVGSTFAHVTKSLVSLGQGVSLVSYDPLVDPDMKDMLHLRPHARVEVIRPTSHESPRRSRSSGLLATGRSLDLLYPYAACFRMKKVYRLAHLLCWLAIPVSLVATCVAVLTNGAHLLSSAYVTVWQLLAVALATGLSVGTVTSRSLFLSVDSPEQATDPDDPDAPKKTEKSKPAEGNFPRAKK